MPLIKETKKPRLSRGCYTQVDGMNWIVLLLHTHTHTHTYTLFVGGGCGVIVGGNRHGDTSSNPGRGWSHFT